MIFRLAYRLLIIIPVTLSIMLITLYLFYQLPGANVFDSSRIEIGSDRELENLIQDQYTQGSFTNIKGLFYAGISRGYVPDSLYLIPPVFRPSFVALSRDVRNTEAMDNYATWIHHTILDFSDQPETHVTSQQFVRLLQIKSKKRLKKEIKSGTYPDLPKVLEQLLEAIPDDDLPFIRVSWHGRQNLFHQYLLGIVTRSPELRTLSGEKVSGKFVRSTQWTLAYTMPVLLLGWGLAYFFILRFYDRPKLLLWIDRASVLLYSFPSFVLATLALIFLTSHRYGFISTLFPFPVFLESDANGLWAILRNYGQQLILPMLLFAIPVLILFYRIFLEKIREIQYTQPSYQYLRHIGISGKTFRRRYLSRYLTVATWAVMSNLLVALLGGSIIIEWIFNIPGLGRYFYESVVNYDIASIVFLVFTFTIVQQLGHVVSDWLLDTYFTPERSSQGLL